MARPSVIIVGGGVVGCSLAYYLAGAGCPVSLLERGQIASGASGAAAGILGPLAESAEPGPFLDLAVAGLRAFQDWVHMPGDVQKVHLKGQPRVASIGRLRPPAEGAM